MLRSRAADLALCADPYPAPVALQTLILDALFPDACLACLAPRESNWRYEVACAECLRDAPVPDWFSCFTCGSRTAPLVPACHPHSAATLALSTPDSTTVGKLTAALLYEGITRAAPPLAELLAAACAGAGMPLHQTVVVPIPEAPREAWARGYAANELIASGTASLLRVPLHPHLLSAAAAGGRALFGIGSVGDAASAELVALVSARVPSRRDTGRLAELVREACPHASVLFVSCTT
jgi:predicted amidophosphoribosyltransferase